MNRRQFALTLPGLAVLASGCRTLTLDERIALAASITRNSVSVGARFYLIEHPEAEPIFRAAQQALAKLIQAQDYDPILFYDALRALPGMLHGEQGALIIQGGISVFELVTSTTFDIASAPAVKAVMTAVYDGLTLALPQASRAIRSFNTRSRRVQL